MFKINSVFHHWNDRLIPKNQYCKVPLTFFSTDLLLLFVTGCFSFEIPKYKIKFKFALAFTWQILHTKDTKGVVH